MHADGDSADGDSADGDSAGGDSAAPGNADAAKSSDAPAKVEFVTPKVDVTEASIVLDAATFLNRLVRSAPPFVLELMDESCSRTKQPGIDLDVKTFPGTRLV